MANSQANTLLNKRKSFSLYEFLLLVWITLYGFLCFQGFLECAFWECKIFPEPLTQFKYIGRTFQYLCLENTEFSVSIYFPSVLRSFEPFL